MTLPWGKYKKNSENEIIGKNPPIAGTTLDTSLLTILFAKKIIPKILIKPPNNPKAIKFFSGRFIPKGNKKKQTKNQRIPT